MSATAAVLLAADDYYGQNPTDAFIFVAIVVVAYIWLRRWWRRRR